MNRLEGRLRITAYFRCNTKCTFELLKVAMTMLFISGPVVAQDVADRDDEDLFVMEHVSVVGSRIKRTALEGPQPTYIIDKETIEKQGYITVYEALQGLAINNGLTVEG